MTKVAIIQKSIPHYRVRFFEELAAQASALRLEMTVYHACETTQNAAYKFLHKDLPIHQFTRNKNGPFWMEGLKAALIGADIIVAPQELQCVNVPYLWATRHRLCKTWIWWGHGYNFQASVRSSWATYLKEALKHFMTRRADGLITYTAGGVDYWKKRGMPENQVFPYYNTIDVEGLRKAGEEVTEQQRAELRRKFGLEGKRVLLFSGRLYAEKKVDFLLRAFAILKKTCPNVALLIIGDGEERSMLERLAAQLDLGDAHFLGEIVDPNSTAVYFSLAELLVIPGLVGLAIVHGFAFGLPMVTTRHDFHSPEIEYLSTDNGVLTRHDEEELSKAIAALFADQHRYETMCTAASQTAEHLLLNLSAQRFVQAIYSLGRQN
jgi:glycosyltransferase involved in cell wall biosynthesis